MRLKELQSELQSLQGFTTPNSVLEQYVTSAHLAAQMLFSASNQFGDIEDRCVLDLGCGTCVLGIAARIMGAAFVSCCLLGLSFTLRRLKACHGR